MQKVQLGNTGFETSRLGVGLSEIGSFELSDQAQATNVLNTALDNGINFLDTSACYGISEELVGNGVSQRRDDYFLATKAGHIARGYEGEAWTFQTVVDSIDRSLRLLQTDHVDVVQLHSCDIDVLEKGDAIRALQEAQQAGKTRFIGYSGDNESAHWAVDSGLFATLQTSYNLVEQRARTTGLLEKAWARSSSALSPEGSGASHAPMPPTRLPATTTRPISTAPNLCEPSVPSKTSPTMRFSLRSDTRSATRTPTSQ